MSDTPYVWRGRYHCVLGAMGAMGAMGGVCTRSSWVLMLRRWRGNGVWSPWVMSGFWTKKRWEEHCQGLKKNSVSGDDAGGEGEGEDDHGALSQGTVGCVCLDQLGGLAVATSAGGLMNKWPGRIGDTSTLGAGFWAESWNTAPSNDQDEEQDEEEEEEDDDGPANENDTLVEKPQPPPPQSPTSPTGMDQSIRSLFANCISSSPFANKEYTPLPTTSADDHQQSYDPSEKQPASSLKPNKHDQRQRPKKRATALSCTGNGDSILRVTAARTASAMLRYSALSIHTLSDAVTAVTGPDGEVQRSAGKRWAVTGEGEWGIIGIEVEAKTEAGDVGGRYRDFDEEDDGGKGLGVGKVVFDFHCGGMWRAWVDEEGRERVMVFRDGYK
ncbi:hypothetical protein SI65_08582 [Aspergillus cristatus]|uniref:Uncharacterized protein n=1 Tax=Aspergillus cristatus TaxID=573508 RepID=A0A1E3B5H8_ASPCR|nr:hypothetical protein SI65_08582 [Aspergillus cristatus]